MGERNLVEQIVSLLEVAGKPLTCADIRLRLNGFVEHSEITSRLFKMKKRGQVSVTKVKNRAITGPRLVSAYSLVVKHESLEVLPTIAKTRENCDFSHRQVASAPNVLVEVN